MQYAIVLESNYRIAAAFIDSWSQAKIMASNGFRVMYTREYKELLQH